MKEHNQDAFYAYHPIVNLAYFVAVIGFSMFLMHPMFLGISLFCGAFYALYVRGTKALRFGLLYMLPLVIITAGLNPLFNHQGATILGYLPNGNPVTLESMAFGIASAVMLVSVIIWFACFNLVMTSDKFIYLFGAVIPSLSLVLSMALGMVPRFRKQLHIIANAQKTSRPQAQAKSLVAKARLGVKIVSILVTWALENSIQTADSMKARGYGLKGRTAFSIFSFTHRDKVALFFIVFCTAFILVGFVTGHYHFRYFPTIRGLWYGSFTVAMFVAYFALALLPIIINVYEDISWRHLQSKI